MKEERTEGRKDGRKDGRKEGSYQVVETPLSVRGEKA